MQIIKLLHNKLFQHRKSIHRPNRLLLATMIVAGIFAINQNALATDEYAATTHGGKYPVYPKVEYGKGEQAEQIKRGEYLTKLGDCIACHTQHGGGKAFAGNYAVKTPFGTIYTPNITHDKETGIGNWTEKQFIKAVRHGISPKGKYYYPAIPYLYFNSVTDQDLKDIWAYLKAIPRVHQKKRENKMMFPFNWRFLQLGWRTLFFQFQKTGPYKPDPKKSALWNRGSYLVNGLGHCGMCHTSMHYFVFKKWVLAAPVRKYYLTGGMVDGFHAPNITSTLLKDTPLEEFADVFLKDKMIGGGEIVGPMAEANHDSLKYLHPEDIKAIDTYLISVKTKAPPRHHAGKGLAAGKQIYNQYCVGCHQTGAGGAPKIGDTAVWEPLLKKGLNNLYKNAINGIKGMPAKGTCIECSNEEIQSAVQYIVSESKPGTAAALGYDVVTKGKPIVKLTLADGQKIYQQSCAVCHDGKYPGAPKVGDKAAWEPLISKGMDTLFEYAIKGENKVHVRGNCVKCNDAEIIAAVKYMVNKSKTKGDYSLW